MTMSIKYLVAVHQVLVIFFLLDFNGASCTFSIGNITNPRDRISPLEYRSGLHLLPDPVSRNQDETNVEFVRICGNSNDFRFNSLFDLLYIYIVLFRESSDNNSYVLQYEPIRIQLPSSVNSVCNSNPIDLLSLYAGLPWRVTEGDRLGVYIPDNLCTTASSGRTMCPAFVETRTNNDEDMVYYYNSITDEEQFLSGSLIINKTDFIVNSNAYLYLEFLLDFGPPESSTILSTSIFPLTSSSQLSPSLSNTMPTSLTSILSTSSYIGSTMIPVRIVSRSDVSSVSTLLPTPSLSSDQVSVSLFLINMSSSICIPLDIDCPLLTEEQIAAVTIASFGFLLSLLSFVIVIAYISLRVVKRRRKKRKRTKNLRSRAPTVMSEATHGYHGSRLSLDADHYELQEENGIEYLRSNVQLINSQQYEYIDDAIAGTSPFPLCTIDRAARDATHSHYSVDNGSIAMADLFEETRPRQRSLPNEYAYGIGKAQDYEEPYWEPANRVDEVYRQLQDRLRIPNIKENNLTIKDRLGSGQFGVVYKAVCDFSTSSDQEDKRFEVAVKTLQNRPTEDETVKFLQEAVIMGQFDHPNILKILGIVISEPMRIIVELMDGDLRNYLLTLAPSQGESVSENLSSILLSFSRQISLGVMYLAFKEYVHRDLAARNVLVSDDGRCKIADFGLSRDLRNENYYKSHGGKIPVKWTAPEAIHYHKYSTASDVWSYGCLLYEIWSLGKKPFQGLTNMEAISTIMTGHRLPPPPGCPRAIYKIMINCWNPDNTKRPSIASIVVSLTQPDFQILKWTPEDVSNYSTSVRTLGSPLNEGHALYTSLQNVYTT